MPWQISPVWELENSFNDRPVNLFPSIKTVPHLASLAPLNITFGNCFYRTPSSFKLGTTRNSAGVCFHSNIHLPLPIDSNPSIPSCNPDRLRRGRDPESLSYNVFAIVVKLGKAKKVDFGPSQFHDGRASTTFFPRRFGRRAGRISFA